MQLTAINKPSYSTINGFIHSIWDLVDSMPNAGMAHVQALANILGATIVLVLTFHDPTSSPLSSFGSTTHRPLGINSAQDTAARNRFSFGYKA